MRLARPLILVIVLLAGCSRTARPGESVTLATTTSTQDSGLLDVLVPMFEERSGVEVKVVAVGTGQALQLGRRGDADVLLVHDPKSEEEFMAEGHGVLRREVMHNDFVLVGPKSDPATIRGEKSVVEAFTRIGRSRSPFVSRGDESGTHQKERQVWKKANVQPEWESYIKAGAGMAQVLRMAAEKAAYTLCDRATYLAQGKQLGLEILLQGDPLLVNRYSVIVVSSEKHPHVHQQTAHKFADFLLSPGAQKAIAEFGVGRYGGPLFFVESADKR